MVVRIRKTTLLNDHWRQAFAVLLASLFALSAVFAFSITLWISVTDFRSPKVLRGLLSAASFFAVTTCMSRYISRFTLPPDV